MSGNDVLVMLETDRVTPLFSTQRCKQLEQLISTSNSGNSSSVSSPQRRDVLSSSHPFLLALLFITSRAEGVGGGVTWLDCGEVGPARLDLER
jgi:hypothetical protein